MQNNLKFNIGIMRAVVGTVDRNSQNRFVSQNAPRARPENVVNIGTALISRFSGIAVPARIVDARSRFNGYRAGIP